MFKKNLLLSLALLGTCVLTAAATPKKEITMLVVPRDMQAIRIAQEISRFYPILLVSYQQTPERLKLYAWNGTGWVDISLEDYVNGLFFANPPKHTILVEPENTPAKEVLVPDGAWCQTGNRLTTIDPRTMTHLLGLHLGFQNRHWNRLARSQTLSVADVNPGLVNISWWQYPEKRPTLDPEADMNHWLRLGITPPAPVESAVIKAEPGTVPPVELPAAKPVAPKGKKQAPKDLPEIDKIMTEINVAAKPAPGVTAEKAAPKKAGDPFSAAEIPAAEVILPPEK